MEEVLALQEEHARRMPPGPGTKTRGHQNAINTWNLNDLYFGPPTTQNILSKQRSNGFRVYHTYIIHNPSGAKLPNGPTTVLFENTEEVKKR